LNLTMARPTLLLIHGFPHDHHLWDDQLGPLSEVADVMAIDLPGFGSRWDAPDILTMEACADDVKAQLDRRGVQNVVLGGLSMGGYVAMAFAERYPAQLAGLILSNTRASADTPEGIEGRKATARDAHERGVTVISRSMLPKVLAPRTIKEHPEIAARVEKMMARQRATAVAAASLGMAARPDRLGTLRHVRVPTLIITGSEDVLMPLPTSEAMREAIAGSELVVIPSSGHLPNVENPEHFNAALINHLRRVERGS
jgi:3-oxoadipate enol-lactonase